MRLSHRIGGCSLLLVFTVMTAPAAARGPQYTVSELTTLGGPVTEAHDLNNAGQAVGRALDPAWVPRAVSWIQGQVTSLGGTGSSGSDAFGISSGGIVVGYKGNATTSAQAAQWVNGQVTFLELTHGHVGSFAYAANDNGQVAGWMVTPIGDARATLWTNGRAQLLPNPNGGGPYWAFSMNSSGQIVGRRTELTFGATQAVLWHNGTLTALPDLGGNYASPVRVNDAGVIAGAAYVMVAPGVARLRPVIWHGPDHEILEIISFTPGLFTVAKDVNLAGQIIGDVANNLDETRAIMWPGADAAPLNLNDLIPKGSGWVLHAATGINDSGEIVGWGFRQGMAGQRSFRLTPVTPVIPADLNGDGAVGPADLAQLLSQWGPCPASPEACPADLNHDGFVGPADLATLLANWG